MRCLQVIGALSALTRRLRALLVVPSLLIAQLIAEFSIDPLWRDRLIRKPMLRGIKRSTALGVHMQVLLFT